MAGSNLAVKARHGFDVVVQNFDSRVNHRFHSGQIAVKVRDQQFDANSRVEALNPKNGFREMVDRRPADRRDSRKSRRCDPSRGL